ncbi:hypothetical protein R2R70_08920 [Cobetia sp. SIMBA_158]|uniref:hypothetical protein n=1 Tax=Cobetia sp. SIMBA_158 TaxID=3081617 RepID=UPI0039812C79
MKLYRGFSGASHINDGSVKNIYRDKARNPVNTPKYIHDIVDKWFYQKFNIKARSECIFCTPDVDVAMDYARRSTSGFVAEVEVSDDCGVIFSEFVSDLNLYIEEMGDTEEDISRWLESAGYQIVHGISDLDIACSSEMMVDCDYYKVEKIWCSPKSY